MARRRRTLEGCEAIVEKFLKDHPRLGTDGWYVTWCRYGNGGDPSYHQGPFRDDQLYVSSSELLSTYPLSAMELLSDETLRGNDRFFLVLWGALVGYMYDDPLDPGIIYMEGKWQRMPGENR